MTKIIKSNEKFFSKAVYLVNGATNLGITTIERCPYCKMKYAYRFYNPKLEWESNRYCISIYDCKCPNCNKEFEFKEEFEKY